MNVDALPETFEDLNYPVWKKVYKFVREYIRTYLILCCCFSLAPEMTKGKKYQTENETTLQTQKAVGNIYVNTEINSRPDSREVIETYEAVDISCTQNSAELSKPLSKESLGQNSRDSQPLMPVAIVRSIRCLQVMCVALLVAVIIMAATLGSVMSDQVSTLDII